MCKRRSVCGGFVLSEVLFAFMSLLLRFTSASAVVVWHSCIPVLKHVRSFSFKTETYAKFLLARLQLLSLFGALASYLNELVQLFFVGLIC